LIFDASMSYFETAKENRQFELMVPAFSYLVQTQNLEDLQRYLEGFRQILKATPTEKIRNLADIKSLKAIANG